MFVKLFLPVFLLQCSVIGTCLSETTQTSIENAISAENDAVSERIQTLPPNNFVKKRHDIEPPPVNSNRWNETIKSYGGSKPFDLDELLDIWDPKTLARPWIAQKYSKAYITTDCQTDISRYMAGVLEGTNWALRMMDASGKRTWGALSGSRYWTGAPELCRDMEKNFEAQKSQEDNETNGNVPPFRVNVNAISLILDILRPGINGTHNITLGLCLPGTCNIRDVEMLIHFAQNQARDDLPRKIEIDHIRNLSHGYSIWEDKTFYVLVVTFAVVIVLVIIGTLYDIGLRYQVLRREEEQQNAARMMRELKTLRHVSVSNEDITISKLWSVKNHNGSLDVCNSKDVPRPLSEALLSFSLLLNLSKLFSLDVGSDTLAPIHGLRFYTMLWIILVHTCLLANEISDNRTFRAKAEEDFLYQTISNGNYSVDTFFFISGCLVSFLYFRTMMKERMREKKFIKGFLGRVLQFLGMLFYRYFRLTPPYLLVIGLIQVSMKWYHDHTLMELPALDYKTCEKFWWRNALYINTYFDMDDRCMVWSWYLANDTQFYTIGLIILIIGASYFYIAALMTGIFLIASWITTAIITLYTEYVPSIQDPFAHYESLYDKPWTRIGPYLIGMAVGWLLFRTDCKIKMNKAVASLGWTLASVTMASIVYGLYGNMFSPAMSAMYTALSHSAWALSVGWVLLACVTGNGGMVNKFLSWKYVYPLSRLTYCVYLLHPALTRAIILRGENSYHLTEGFVALLFFGVIVISYGTSLLISLFFEAPMVSLLRIVHPLRRWKRD